jgi:hypothetical protein
MRKVLIATLVAAGVAFVGTSAGSAFPVNNNTVVKQGESMKAPTTNVWWRRHHCHGYYSRWWWC